MKHLLTPALLLCILTVQAQITIDDSDMPSAGNKIRVSIGDISSGIDYNTTGPNQLWDFSNLQWISQDVDTFLTIGQTGLTFQLAFANIPLNPNRANSATKGTLQAPSFAGVSVSDVLAFYYNSSTAYKQVGYGANINGIPTPMSYTNHDVIYTFPLNFGLTDTSDSDLHINLPSLLYYGFTQKRINNCDGWGTLITPFGQFDVLRIKSTLIVRDTVYLDSLGIGFGFNRPVRREYKWLGKSKGIPLLQINTNVGTGGNETITQIRYQDSLRVLSVNEPVGKAPEISVYPNPATDAIWIELSILKQAEYLIELVTVDGKTVTEIFNGNLSAGKSTVVFLPKQHQQINKGVYILKLKGDGYLNYKKIIILD